MILAVDLNPKLCREFYLEDFARGKDFVAADDKVYASGVGINAAKLMLNLKEDVTLVTFLGGENGILIKDELDLKDVMVKEISIKDKTQQVILLKEKKRNTRVNTKFPRITREEFDDFLSQYNNSLQSKNTVFIGENDNSNIPDNYYASLIKLANDSRIKTCVNYKGINLDSIISSLPFLIVLSKEQMENYSKLNLTLTSEVIKVCESIISKGISIVIVTNESKDVIIVTTNGNYLANFNGDDSSGELDNNLLGAGCAIGLNRDYDIETCLKLGLACALSSKERPLDEINMGQTKKIMKDIELKKTNRRIL